MKKLSLLSVGAFALSLAACGDDNDTQGPDVPTPQPPEEIIVPIEEQPLESWNLMDDAGRVIIPRGVNYAGSAKGPTGLATTLEEIEVDAAHFRELGFNTIRFLIQWKNVEPVQGEYDLDYLAAVRERLDVLWEQGLYVVLDMHQDVYSPYFNFNGAPEWAVEDDGIPYVLQDQWFTNYMQPAVQRAFDNFFAYQEYAYLQNAYAAMWKKTAEVLGDHPAVLAYDIINEPHPGTALDYIEFASDNPRSTHIAFDRERLQPFYQRVINAIREVDSDNWIMYEPRYGVPGDGGKCYMGKLDDPREGNRRLFQAPHLYILTVEANHTYTDANASRVLKWEAERNSERDRNVHGVWLGEFGTFPGVEGFTRYMDDVIALTERMRIGFAGWSWDAGEFGMIGSRDPDTLKFEEGPFLDHLSRPYGQFYAGLPTHFEFNPNAGVFNATWTVDHSISAPTEFYLGGERWDGENVEISFAGNQGEMVEYAIEDGVLSVSAADDSLEEISITLKFPER